VSKNVKLMKRAIAVFAVIMISPVFAQTDPPVKMSSSGICHAQGSTYYTQTKKFTVYKTIDECLKAGGRIPKR